jgi:Tfp pilus assembly protein PilO
MEINFPKTPEPKIDPTKLLKGKGSLLEFWILVIVLVLFAWFILLPKYKEVQTLNNNSQTLGSELKVIIEQQAKLKNLISQIDSHAKEITILDESLPLHPRTTWLYLLIQNLAGTSGITLSDLSVNNEKESVVSADSALIDKPFAYQRFLRKSLVNMKLSGSMAQFLAFLTKLENSGRIMDVKSLDIQSSSDGVLDFGLTLDAYYFAP